MLCPSLQVCAQSARLQGQGGRSTLWEQLQLQHSAIFCNSNEVFGYTQNAPPVEASPPAGPPWTPSPGKSLIMRATI
eukprot:scaffold188790_cov24-Tisochrysis_lutea.AAC.1